MSAPVDQCVAAAIDWRVRLTSGNVTKIERDAFARWLSADPQNHAAWEHVQGLLGEPVQKLLAINERHPKQMEVIRKSLIEAGEPAARRRSVVRGSAMVFFASVGAGLLAHRSQPLGELFADFHTGTAETKHVALPDGSELDLNARSAADLRFDAAQRLVDLRAGELLVKVAIDSTVHPNKGSQYRPFIVHTKHGSAQALGTRYLVRQELGRTLVVVLEHSVAMHSGNGVQRTIHAGQAAWMDGKTIVKNDKPLTHRTGWTEGVLDVRDESLGDVIAELRSWHKGLIRISPAAAALRVFGVFRLRDTQQVMQALADTQPITVTTYGPMLTLIDVQ